MNVDVDVNEPGDGGGTAFDLVFDVTFLFYFVVREWDVNMT